jgi:hypothetical protein
MFCKLLEFLIENAPSDAVKAELQAVYDEYCGGDVGTNDTGDNGNPPK